MTTLANMETMTGKSVLDYLDRQAEVPTVQKFGGAQGDVLILPVTTKAAETKMPKMVVVVQSEASSNTHTLHPNGECFFDAHKATSEADILLGKLTVPEGSTAFMSHQEHGGIEILAGTYEIRRQREFAGEWAYVHD